MRYYRTTGLMLSQMQELVSRVSCALEKPWAKRTGRPKSLGLYRAVEVACMYIRQNATQEFIGDMRDISQPTVSRYAKGLVPVVKAVLEEFVPSAADAIEMVNGRVCLADGTITPCWSCEGHDELWSRKHGTTDSVPSWCLLSGDAVYVSDPLDGKTHDATAFSATPVAQIVASSGGGIADKGYQGCAGVVTPRKKPRGGALSPKDKEDNARISGYRAPVEQVFAHFKSWRILHTDYRRPYHTYREAFDAARALFFFSLTWGFE